ncbi:MAG: tetratricopeptide repeat protein, partial [Cyanothece sp. SIO1E1]|nr:tetratricopeptide repeat protein [Cyanothece sp. SIO1E1]
MNTPDLLQHLCNQYDQTVSQLTAAEDWPAETVLAMLKNRDRIQQLLAQFTEQPNTQDIPPSIWLQLTNTDTQLRTQILARLAHYKPLKSWHQSFAPPAHYWWWYPATPVPPKDPMGWLWGGFTITALTVNLALAQDIATRFLAGAPGLWSSVGAIAPIVLTLLASGGALTQLGERILESVLSNRGTAKHQWPKLKFGLSALLLLGLFTFHYEGLPRLARHYNSLGKQQYFQEGKLSSAQVSYERALNLNPDYPEAQFNLGLIYEDLQELDNAKAAYAKAVHAGYLDAFNNLARIALIRDKDYNAAIVLLSTALQDKRRNPADVELEYVLLKNLGWVRLLQGRLLEAESELREAIRLDSKLTEKRPDAHCLLAQILEQLDDADVAKPEWETCLRYVSRPEDE